MAVTVQTELTKVKDILSVNRFDRMRHALANQMLADMNMYVPRRDGTLRETGLVEADLEHISWDTRYAKAQFYGTNGKVVFRNYTTPGTGKRWDLVGSANHMSAWLRVVKKGLGL